MFLDWINEINLLSHNPETNIISKFPYATKRILIYEITNCFIHQNNKTINGNLNSYINSYSELNLTTSSNTNTTSQPNSNSSNNNNNSNNNNTINKTNINNNDNNININTNISTSKKAANASTPISPTINSPVLPSLNISLNNDETNNNPMNNISDNNFDTKSSHSYSYNSISNAQSIEVDTNISTKQDNILNNENEINNENTINNENSDSSKIYPKPSTCPTETFITSPKIDSKVPWTWLTSVEHVQWVMEIIGQAFALPPTEDNVKIIQNACAIYTQWLLDPKARPNIIQAKEGTIIEQVFWQKIFHHFSLLFNINEKTTIYHQELCKQVLSIISMAERTLSSKFSEETWIILLKVLLGISDYLLKEPLGKPNQEFITSSIMADKLCDSIVRVLIESWLRSQTMRNDMWDYLKNFFKNWTHRIGVVEHWNATLFGLTQKVINILYGPNFGKNNVNIVINGCIISLDLSSDFVIYSWAQTLYMIGDISNLSPNNFNCFLTGISNVVDLFHTIDSKYEDKYEDDKVKQGSSPDGNTILNLFSRFLFKALSITKDDKEYNKGKAIAYSTLCKIIFRPQIRLPINQIYLDRSYLLLSQGLDSDFLSITSIIKNSRVLFQQELKGSKLLFPDYILSIFKLLPKIFSVNLQNNKSEIPNPDEDFDYLRSSCYVILSHIYSYPNHFFEIPIREELQDNEIINGNQKFMIDNVHTDCFNLYKLYKNSRNKLTFGSLKPIILEILLSSLQFETNEENIAFLLYLIYCYTYDDIKNTKGLLKISNEVIINTIILKKDYSLKLTKDTIDTLYLLSSLQSYDIEYEPQDLVMKFCVYIDILLMEDNIVPYQFIICKAYEVIVNWIINGTWIFKYKYCLNCVISILSKGIYCSDKQSFINMPNVVNLVNMEGKVIDEPLSEFLKRKLIKRNNIPANLQSSKINSKDGISTVMNDGDVSVTSFDILKIALIIEYISEICLNLILNYYGTLPPYGNNTSICNIDSLWKEDDELIELIKLKYSKDKDLQLENKSKEEIIQIYLNKESDNNLIQYYSYQNEYIVGVLSLPTWYVNIKKKEYYNNNKPVMKSNSTNTRMNEDNNDNDSTVHPVRPAQSETLNINTNINPIQYNTKECMSPERVMLYELKNQNLQYYPLEKMESQSSLNSPQSNKQNKSENSLYGKYSNNNDETFNSNKNDNNNNTKNDIKDKFMNSTTQDISPKQQSNVQYKNNMYPNSFIKSLDENKLLSNNFNEEFDQEDLKDRFVAYIVRNYTGKFTWISSLKYENNFIMDDISSILNKSKNSLYMDKSDSLSQENLLPRYCNSTNNINLNTRLNEDDFTKFKELRQANLQINEINENGLTKSSESEDDNNEYKILKCTCFNEKELPNNHDIIDSKNEANYQKVKKISEILEKSEKRIYEDNDLNINDYKRIKSIEMPKCQDLNDSNEKDSNLRLHLIHNNFISLENYNSLIPLKKSINLFKELNELDKTSSRDRFTYSVFYVANNESTIEEIFQPKFINKDFKSFIYSMCWLVDPKTHHGFLGGFTNESKQNIPYYADKKVEMILHIPYFIDDEEFDNINDSKNEQDTDSSN